MPNSATTAQTRTAITAERAVAIANECGFELAGIAAAIPAEDYSRFEAWRAAGFAAEMTYLTDKRGDVRSDPRNLLPSARSILCVGKLYNTAAPHTAEFSSENHDEPRGWVSRYAWGEDYHDVMRRQIEQVVSRLSRESHVPFESRICVDTAPLLERTYARLAGLGWIGKNTCLINQQKGSWFFLGEILLSLDLTPATPAPDRCGTCTRCIDICPTVALVPDGNGGYTLDATKCISYLTIEKRSSFTETEKAAIGEHLFGCDLCQDVCPWNRKAPVTTEPAFIPQNFAPELTPLLALTEDEFRSQFRQSPLARTKYAGLRRNVEAVAANVANAARDLVKRDVVKNDHPE